MTDTWNPAQYDRFQREREQPFFDLLGLLQHEPRLRIVDLGCGTGRLTRVLHERMDARETLGIDRSANMLAEAMRHGPPPNMTFEVGTIEAFEPSGRFDVIFSNAALHWVDHHDALVRRLAAGLPAGGQLAFQVPAMHGSVSHATALEVATVEPFRTAFGGWRRSQPVLAPEAYARLLYRAGFAEQQVKLSVYPHVLGSAEDVVEWTKGTLLTDFQQRLGQELFTAFLAEYRSRLLARLGTERPFFFPFERILCWGRKPRS